MLKLCETWHMFACPKQRLNQPVLVGKSGLFTNFGLPRKAVHVGENSPLTARLILPAYFQCIPHFPLS